MVANCGTPGITLTHGKYGPVFQNTSGTLCTNSTGGAGGGGLAVTDGTTFTAGTSLFTPIGGEYNSSPTSLTSGDQGTLALSSNRAAFVDVMTTTSNLYTVLTSATPAGTNVIGYVSNDPCSQQTKLGAVINTTGSLQIIAGTSAKKTYICAIDVVVSVAQNVALVEGTGTACATNIFGLAGGTTAATGWNFSANSGIARGAGNGTVYSPSADTNGSAANICLLSSGTAQLSGQISYVQQ